MSLQTGEERKKRGCGFGCLVIVCIFLGLGVLVVLGAVGALLAADSDSRGCGNCWSGWKKGGHETGEDENPFMHEIWSMGSGNLKVVRIPVNGMITLGEESWYSGNANSVLRSIRRATHDEDVKGLLLEVNSGGGGITDSDIIYKALQEFKAHQKGRVIVTLMGDVAASGAYYIALASDKILAHPTSLTGSIGVIMQTYNVKELAEKLGVRDVTIKSGANKDMLNPFREVKPEQEELLQRVIAAMHERFITLVAENRKLAKERVAELADGRIFVAQEALERSLIDGIGYQADAHRKLAELLEVDSVKVYRYDEQMTLMDIFMRRPGIGFNTWLQRALGEAMSGEGRLMYRWSW